MAQPGVLGNLKYTEQENGWALSFGYNLGLYEVMSMAIRPVADRDTETTSISNKRETALKDLNHELKRRHIQYEIPDTTDADRLVWLTQDLFEQFGRHPLAAQLPYVLIGTAVYSLVARHLVGGILDDYFLGVAYSRLEALTYRCDDVNVQVDALFIHLSRCTTLESARRLLRQLQAHMTILLVSADPQDQDRLRLTTEERALQEALRSADYNQSFKFKTLPSCRPGDLASGLRRYRPTFVHFSGHGSKTGLCFEDANGNAVLIEPEKLAGLLALACESGLKGVVLNACYTKEQADCIANVVGDVVAMEGLVGDEAAIDFASQFYAALGDGCEFHHAFNWALAGTGLGRSTGLLKPHLIRSKLVIDAHNIHKPTPKTRDDGSGLAARDSSANRSVDDLEEGIYTGTGHMDETLRRVAAERNSPTANPFASPLIRRDSMVQALEYSEENLAPKGFTESIENAKMKKRAPPVPLPKKEKLRDRRNFEQNILAVADADQGFLGSSSSQMRKTPASLPMFSLTASSQLADAPESSNDERAGTHLGNDEVYPKSGNNTAQGGAEL